MSTHYSTKKALYIIVLHWLLCGDLKMSTSECTLSKERGLGSPRLHSSQKDIPVMNKKLVQRLKMRKIASYVSSAPPYREVRSKWSLIKTFSLNHSIRKKNHKNIKFTKVTRFPRINSVARFTRMIRFTRITRIIRFTRITRITEIIRIKKFTRMTRFTKLWTHPLIKMFCNIYQMSDLIIISIIKYHFFKIRLGINLQVIQIVRDILICRFSSCL